MKTIQEDFNNVDDENVIGIINSNNYKFMSSLNASNHFINNKQKIENELKIGEDNIDNIKRSETHDNCTVF